MIDDVERGVGAGAIAGVAYGAYVAAVANPLVAHAESAVAGARAAGGDATETGAGHAGEHGAEAGHAAARGAANSHGHEHAATGVSELTTALAGVGGGVLWGILLGAAFGAAFYLFEPALPGRGSTKTLVLGCAGFLTVSGVPWLVLPPSVPGVEPAIGADARLATYGALVVAGAGLAAVSIVAFRRVAARRGAAIGAGAAVAPLLAVGLALPAATPALVGGGSAPSTLVAAFRGVVVLGQVGLWAAIAASFTWLRERTGVVRSAEGESTPVPVGSGD